MVIKQSVCTLLAVGNAYRVHCSTFLIYNTIVNEILKPLTCIIIKYPQIVKAFLCSCLTYQNAQNSRRIQPLYQGGEGPFKIHAAMQSAVSTES